MKKIFAPVNIGRLELKNRIVMPPMGTGYANRDGTVSERLKKYYARRAAGGAGLIIVEVTAVAPEGIGFPCCLGIWDDGFIAGLSELAGEIKSNGARAALQIFHAGRQTRRAFIGTQPVGPSAVPWPPAGEMPRELGTGEVRGLVEKFSDAALRAKKAGFDAVEFHGAHGYLICQFLSPQSNRRTDEYGGRTPERRAAFALEIVGRTREKAGAHFPLLFRLSAEERIKDGITLNDSRVTAALLEDAGVDAIHVSAGNYGAMWWVIQPMMMERGCLVPLAAELRKHVSIPVIAVGRINDPELAESVLREGKADLIAMGRALIADPDLPNKFKDGRRDEIRMCAACNVCADEFFSSGVTCMQNAEAGRETERWIEPAAKRKNVVIMGGGPAGMEAARVCAIRGHDVTLVEKTGRLGGALNLAVIPPGKGELENLIRYYCAVLPKLGVKIEPGKAPTADDVRRRNPDVVIIATGGRPVIPEAAGAREKIVTAEEVLSGKAPAGARAAVFGGSALGCEVALFLAEAGREVTLIARRDKWGRNLSPSVRAGYYAPGFKRHNVNILTNAGLEEVTEEGVYIRMNGERQFVKADSVVLAAGFEPDGRIYESLKDAAPEVYAIGDCRKAGTIRDAVHEAYDLCRRL
ncbi:MAG: NAD(P)/FAD-dependent oxidoreductase [bacterium]